MIDRPTSRLIVLDPDGRVLLFLVEDPAVSEPDHPRESLRRGIFWHTPGGGVEPGETYEDAAHRELWEETGITLAELGPVIFTREKTRTFPDTAVRFLERYFLARVQNPTVSLANHTAIERRVYRAHRWWPPAELETTTDAILPECLPHLVKIYQPSRPT